MEQRLIDASKFEVVSLQGKSEEFINGVTWMLEQIDKAKTVKAISQECIDGLKREVQFRIDNMGDGVLL